MQQKSESSADTKNQVEEHKLQPVDHPRGDQPETIRKRGLTGCCSLGHGVEDEVNIMFFCYRPMYSRTITDIMLIFGR